MPIFAEDVFSFQMANSFNNRFSENLNGFKNDINTYAFFSDVDYSKLEPATDGNFKLEKMLTEAQDTSSSSSKARACYIAGGIIGAVGIGILLYSATNYTPMEVVYAGIGTVLVGGVVALIGLKS